MFSQLERYLPTIDCAAMLVARQGKILFRYGDDARRYPCHSMRKSFLSALFGCGQTESRVDWSLTLAQLGIDDRQGLSPQERQATLYDLLMARSGVYHPANYETAWMKSIKPPRHRYAPGDNWCYNNWDFNVLGSVWRQVTGEEIHDAFHRRIASPIGMQDFRPEQDGGLEPGEFSDHPAYPFRLSSRDLLRFGQLFLQQGAWDQHPVIAAHWVRTSTQPISHAGCRGAYGAMWWVTRDGVAWPGVILPNGSYSAQGAGGHFCLVVPSMALVIVHRVDTDTPGREVNRFQAGRLLQLFFDSFHLKDILS